MSALLSRLNRIFGTKSTLPFHRHPEKKHYLYGYGISFILATAGIILFYADPDKFKFSYAGVLIVVFGLLFAWNDIRGKFRRAEEFIKGFSDNGNPITYNENYGERRDVKLLNMEMFMLISGTVISGFGDVLHIYLYIPFLFFWLCAAIYEPK